MTGIGLLAKSDGETIAEHTGYCLKAASAILKCLPLPREHRQRIEEDVFFAIAVHDMGKAATGFQRMLRKEQSNWAGRRHEILSASFASTLPGISAPVLLAILTHHKSLPGDGVTASGAGCLPFEQLPMEGHMYPVWSEMAGEWRENVDSLAEEWIQICKAWGKSELLGAPFELGRLPLEPAWLNRTSGKNGQLRTIDFSERFHASLVRGLTIASDHLGSAHLVPKAIPDLKTFPVLEHKIRPFQEIASQTDGSAILRAPTGSGKTEAALLWAQRNQAPNGRLFYVLPHTASINAMYRRLGPGGSSPQRGIFGAEKVGLLHSRATASLYTLLEGNNDDSSQLNRQRNAKEIASLAREMWFPIRVCTPHQVLRHILRGKGWEYMVAEFPNASFIFDEVHAYDPRVAGLTLGAARRLVSWGARILFLSATFPDFLLGLVRQALGNIPVIVPDPAKERDREILDRKRHIVTMLDGTLNDYLREIITSVGNSDSTLIVCNHVLTAQNIAKRLRDSFGDSCVLLHSRFNQRDRNHIEERIMRRPAPRVLVATQVVEVSLDIDFDQAFLEPAPIDALVQRMGRVNRAGQRQSGPATVTLFSGQVNKRGLYCNCSNQCHTPDCRVRKSLEELRQLPNPISEDDLVKAANRVYSDGYYGAELRDFEQGLNHPDIIGFEERLLAGAHQDWVEHVIESTDGTVEILPKCLREDYQAKIQEGLWVEANALLVPTRSQSLRWLNSNLDTSSDPWTINAQYSESQGLEL